MKGRTYSHPEYGRIYPGTTRLLTWVAVPKDRAPLEQRFLTRRMAMLELERLATPERKR